MSRISDRYFFLSFPDGEASLISQGCPDLALLAVAAKDDTNDSPLSFVHFVKDDDKKTCHGAEGDGGDEKAGGEDDYVNDSGEEFEMEDDNGIVNQKLDSADETSDEEYEFE